jgi:hypothetical protein
MLPEEVTAALQVLLPALDRHNVEVIAIGGLAVAYHGHRRVSGGQAKGEIKAEFDFWYNPTTENYVRLLGNPESGF